MEIEPRHEVQEFYLSTTHDWKYIKPKNNDKKLYSEWTNVLNQKLAEFYPLCVAKFKYHRINKDYKTHYCPFLIAKESVNLLWIDIEPDEERDVKVNLLARGQFLSNTMTKKHRFLVTYQVK